MFLRHFLAKGHNMIPLKNLEFATEHTQKGDAEGHVGWKIKADYGGDNERSQKHRYEIVFDPEEARLFRDKLDKLISRFDESVAAILERDVEVSDVEDDEGGDDGGEASDE